VSTAIVTGAAGGLGGRIGERLAAAGHDLLLVDLDPAVEGVAAARGARAVVADLTRPEGVDTVVAAAGEGVAVLVNNAGITRDAQLVKWRDSQQAGEMSERDFDAVISVNLKGVFLCTRAVAPRMIAGGGGRILNASSVVGLYGNFGQTNYAATKAAVINMTKTWARELGRYNIRVNAVAPGFIATAMTEAMTDEARAGMESRIALRRLGTPDDVAYAVVFLASQEASYITGTVLNVSGGLYT